MIAIYTATEDELSELLADQLLFSSGLGDSPVIRMGRKGSGYLKQKLAALVTLSQHIPVLMLIDLDQAECAPLFVDKLLDDKEKPNSFLLRVVVREAESWVMADGERFADYFGVPRSKVPQQPDSLDDPKSVMLSLIWRYGRGSLREEVVTHSKSGLRQGFLYNQRLRHFIEHDWRMEVAVEVSDSLARALRAVQALSVQRM